MLAHYALPVSQQKSSFGSSLLRKASPNANEALRYCLRGIGSGRRARIVPLGLPRLGQREAERWVRQLRTAFSKQLAIVPKGFPLAQEDDEFSAEIRQMVVGRYRMVVYHRRAQSSRAPR